MISVICCYNKTGEYEKMKKTLLGQDVSYELIGVKNDNNAFNSAAAALNWGAQKAKGDILVFLHQDVLFCKEDSLRRLADSVMESDNSLTVVGLFGASRKVSNIYIYGQRLAVQETLDECCVAMSRETWQKIKFNEQLCDGWHLYMVEFCIRLRQNGGLALSGDFDIQHLSTGTVDENYMKALKQLLIVYKREKWIHTTCKSMPTNLSYFYGYYFLWRIKKFILGNYNLVFNIKNFWREGKK